MLQSWCALVMFACSGGRGWRGSHRALGRPVNVGGSPRFLGSPIPAGIFGALYGNQTLLHRLQDNMSRCWGSDAGSHNTLPARDARMEFTPASHT